jgi:hypothetical protein
MARRCLVLAIKAKSVINFEELLALKAVKTLTTKDKELHEFFSLFITTDASNFKGQMQKYAKTMASEHITQEEAITKKSYLQICTLSTQTSNFKYSELSQLLNIDEGDIEEWAIEAIHNKIMDAKIDQLHEEIIIKSHIMREIKAPEWVAIQSKIQLWKEKFEAMRHVLAATQAGQ